MTHKVALAWLLFLLHLQATLQPTSCPGSLFLLSLLFFVLGVLYWFQIPCLVFLCMCIITHIWHDGSVLRPIMPNINYHTWNNCPAFTKLVLSELALGQLICFQLVIVYPSAYKQLHEASSVTEQVVRYGW